MILDSLKGGGTKGQILTKGGHVPLVPPRFCRLCNSHECMGVNGEALQLQQLIRPVFLLQVTRKSVLALQVMHAVSEYAMRLKSLSPWYQAILEKYNDSFVAVGIITRAAHL